MIYTNIENYLKSSDSLNSELWIFDNEFYKESTIRNLAENKKVTSTSIETFFSFLQSENKKDTLSQIEVKILIEKIIDKNVELKFLKNQSGLLNSFIELLNITRLYPDYDNKKLESNLRYYLKLIYDLYRNKCQDKKNNFKDFVSNLYQLSKVDIPKKNNFNRVVLIGEFFYLSQTHWQVLFNYLSKYSEVVFISNLGEYIDSFYQSKNYLEFNQKIKTYFNSNNPDSLNHQLNNLDLSDLKYNVFADWEDEINHIAYLIKEDFENGIFNYSEIGVYIPDKIYEFKISKIFDDYQIPFFNSFEDKLSSHPLMKFIYFWLEMDWNQRADIFKFLNSPFLVIDYSDYTTEYPMNEKFLDIDLSQIELEVKEFNRRFIEEIMLKSGCDFILYRENIYSKIKSYFEKESKFGILAPLKVAEEYKMTLYHLDYFYKIIDKFRNILPSTAYANDFSELFKSATEYFEIQDKYTENETVNNFYQTFLSFISEITFYINKVNNIKHSLSDYSKFLRVFSQSVSYKTEKLNEGVLISDSNYINKANLKKIYMVGLTSKLFPKITENNAFSKALNDIYSQSEKDIQLLTFYNILKAQNNQILQVYLSQPNLVNSEETKKSEILIDLKMDSNIDKKTYDKNHSLSSKIFQSFINNQQLSEKSQRILEIYKNRGLNYWTKYEGHLEDITESDIFNKKTSVTQIEEFAKCPMSYFFKRKLKLKAIRAKTEDIEGNVKGIIIHKILEIFYNKLISENLLNIPISEKQKMILAISNDVFKDFENIYDNLYLDQLKYIFNIGLLDEKKKGILQKTLEVDQESINQGWLPVKTENDFHYKLEDFSFTGSIDRIDQKGDYFRIIDYKSGGHDTLKEIEEGIAFQIPVYSMAYQNQSGKSLDSASYYPMKNIDKISPYTVMPDKKVSKKEELILKDNQSIINITLENLSKVKSAIKKSQFNFTLNNPENTCTYCDYSKSCHYDPEKIVLLNQSAYKNNQYFQPLNADIFLTPRGFNSGQGGLTDEQKLSLDTDKNIIVTAGAGAGKTEVLTQRMINLLHNVKGEINKILVITFTKKATSEMQSRIYSSIVEKITKNEDPNGYYLKAKQNFHENRISTMDGFYMRVLKENSLDLKLENDLSISESSDVKDLVAQTIEKTIDNLAKEKDINLRKLLYVWSRKNVIENISKLLEQDWIYDFIAFQSVEAIDNLFKNIFFKDVDQHIKDIEYTLNNNSDLPPDVSNCLLNWKYEFIRFKENFDNYNIPNIDKSFDLPRNVKKNEIDADLSDNLKDKVKLFRITIKFIDISKLEKEYLISLVNVIKKVEKNYNDKKKKDNINTFNDIAFMLYKMLKENNNGIREKLKDKFTYIMIDEFQDTSLMQWEIAKYLSGWNGLDYSTMSKDKLFIVGDDKQSIYGFRGGDVKVFNRAKKEIVEINNIHDINGGFVKFPDNFRSSTNIIDFFNNFFSVLFSNSQKDYEAEHQNLKGHKNDGSINFFLFNSEKNDDSEAIFIAKQINKIRQAEPKESIAILFRTKAKMPKFIKALESLKINYLVTGGRDFYQRSEIKDIFNILAFLSDETRKIELTGFLRSLMIGLSDTEIYKIKDDLVEGLKTYPEIYQMIYGQFEDGKLIKKGWKHDICDLSIHQIVIKIINETYYKSSLNQHKDSIQKIKNIEKFIEISKENEDMTLNEFVSFLEYQLKNNNDTANATIIEMDNKSPAVQLMTIHASKGLGFDTVIVADCNSEGKKIGAGETMSFGEIEDIKYQFIGFKIPSEDKFEKQETNINRKILDYKREKEATELKRLLYVALTRVEYNLIISATIKKNLQGFMKLFSDYFGEMCKIENEAFISKKIKDIDFHIFNCDFSENEADFI